MLEKAGVLDWGDTDETEFFVMRLRNKYARAGLTAYAAAQPDDPQYAAAVLALAEDEIGQPGSGTVGPEQPQPL